MSWFRNPLRPYDPPEPEPEVRMIVKPGGALVDPVWAEAESMREQARAKSLEALRASQAADAEVERVEAERNRVARDEAHRRELPPHLRELLP